MPCALAGKRQSRCAHDGGKVAPGVFKLFVYNNIIELGPVAYFLSGGAQSPLDRFFAVLSAPAQPALELLQHRGRGQDEDAHRVGKGGSDLLGALPVDFEHDIQALCARFGDPLLRCAVAVSVDLGRFQELATAHRSEEHTSELQSQFHLVCRLLLEKKKEIRSLYTVLPLVQ